jgi:hypothetical protein
MNGLTQVTWTMLLVMIMMMIANIADNVAQIAHAVATMECEP